VRTRISSGRDNVAAGIVSGTRRQRSIDDETDNAIREDSIEIAPAGDIKGLSAAVNPIPMTICSGMNFVQLGGTSRMETHFCKLCYSLVVLIHYTGFLKSLERTHERAW
jgi:hypothetical protein